MKEIVCYVVWTDAEKLEMSFGCSERRPAQNRSTRTRQHNVSGQTSLLVKLFVLFILGRNNSLVGLLFTTKRYRRCCCCCRRHRRRRCGCSYAFMTTEHNVAMRPVGRTDRMNSLALEWSDALEIYSCFHESVFLSFAARLFSSRASERTNADADGDGESSVVPA